MATHFSTLAWKIPWKEEPGRLQSMGSQRVGTTERLHFHFSLSCIGEGNGNPLQCSCLENPRDRGASGLPSMGSHRVRHDWSDLAAAAAAARGNQVHLNISCGGYTVEVRWGCGQRFSSGRCLGRILAKCGYSDHGHLTVMGATTLFPQRIPQIGWGGVSLRLWRGLVDGAGPIFRDLSTETVRKVDKDDS